MGKRVIVSIGIVILTLGAYALGTQHPALPVAAQAGDQMCFPQTGKCVGGIFLRYWQANGGLRQQGYPISDEFDERNAPPPAGDGQVHRVQYFERARFEHHPDKAGTEFEVLLGLLGSEQYQAKYGQGMPGATGTPAAGTPTMTPTAGTGAGTATPTATPTAGMGMPMPTATATPRP